MEKENGNGIEGTAFARTGEVNGRGENGQSGTWAVKVGLAQMLKGGVIMDVVTPDQAKIAEEAGACAGTISLRMEGMERLEPDRECKYEGFV